ncbi:hypothetical protein E4U41_004958 [Claviceps citrina]|nr:hypothetical protein E4U41_004958 [Claviceps citrina]
MTTNCDLKHVSVVLNDLEQFDGSPHPKPLPAAVLFKAYDDVLPTFGIDPDADHHLSALIFRIGGESGNGTLLEKFHALLKRMGILLEFDDDVTISDLPSPGPSTSHREAAESSPETSGSHPADEGKDDAGPCLKQLGVVSAMSDRGLNKTSEPLEKQQVKITDAHQALRKSAMISAIDRWRKVTSGESMARKTKNYPSMVVSNDQRPQNSMNNVSTAKNQLDLELNAVQTQIALGAAADDLSTAENDALLHRAVRARQIFLASRILSRWADETAARLEREAIARRHMVRFRCFNSWLQTPYSKLPRIRCLKARCAVQKLQRVMACHAEQLESTASMTVTLRISRMALTVLNFWLGSVLSQSFASNVMRLVRDATFNRWFGQTLDCNKTRSAQQLATTFDQLRWLRTWRSRTEIGIRADSCRQVLAMEDSAQSFDIWRLRAQAEAIRGKREYTFVTRHINTWLAGVSRHSALQATSGDYCRFNSATKLAGQLARFARTKQQLDVLGYRALWYIRATSLLEGVDAVVRHRKQQMKQVVRRHLMMRYTQVSSKRRQRGFYTALSQWQSHTTSLEAMGRAAVGYQALDSGNRKRAIYAIWREQAAQEAESHTVAANLPSKQFIQEWRKRASADHQQELDAAELWATEQQRQFLKAWARSTLQKGGQAHSADMARRRHERDHRNRAFQRWRQLASRPKHVDASPGLHSPALTAPVSSSRRTALKHLKWLPLSRRLDYKQEAVTPMHTPSRSTGLLFSSAHAPVLRFADSVGGTNRKAQNSVARGSNLGRHTPTAQGLMPGQGHVPTTTPKVPAPSHAPIASRDISSKTGHQEKYTLVNLTPMPSRRGPAAQAPGSLAGASRSRTGEDDIELPRQASDAGTPSHDYSLAGSNTRLTFPKSGPARMRRWQSGLRTEVATPSMSTGKALRGEDGAGFP